MLLLSVLLKMFLQARQAIPDKVNTPMKLIRTLLSPSLTQFMNFLNISCDQLILNYYIHASIKSIIVVMKVRNISFLWSVIIVKGSLELPLLPYPLYYLVVYLQFTCPMLQSFEPSASKYFAVGKEEGSSAVLQSLLVLSFVPVSIGPSKYSIASEESLQPFSFVCSSVRITECPLTIKITLRELTFIYSRLANIMPIPFLNSSLEISFIIRPISKFLFSFPVGLIFLPHACILIILKGIKISAFAMRLAVLDLTFVNASIIKYISSLYSCFTIGETALVVRTFFEVKLSFTMESIIQPISSIVSFRP